MNPLLTLAHGSPVCINQDFKNITILLLILICYASNTCITTRLTCSICNMSAVENNLKNILGVVRALAVNVESNGNKIKLLALSQKSIMEKLVFLEDWAVSGGSVSLKKSSTVPTTNAGANMSRLEGSTSLLLQGLFNGAQINRRCIGWA